MRCLTHAVKSWFWSFLHRSFSVLSWPWTPGWITVMITLCFGLNSEECFFPHRRGWNHSTQVSFNAEESWVLLKRLKMIHALCSYASYAWSGLDFFLCQQPFFFLFTNLCSSHMLFVRKKIVLKNASILKSHLSWSVNQSLTLWAWEQPNWRDE